MNILLIGGNGVIGSGVVKFLVQDKNNRVFVTTRKELYSNCKNHEYVIGDEHDNSLIERVIRKNFFEVIIDFMQYELKEFCERLDLILSRTKQYFFLSSSRVYANTDKKLTNLPQDF